MARAAAKASPHLISLRETGVLPPLFLVHGGAGDELSEFGELARLLGPDQPCYSFHLIGAKVWRAMKRVEDLAAHYRRSMEPKIAGRPFFLAGYSFGGNVAYEMAIQLASSGTPPIALVLLDTPPPSTVRLLFGLKGWERVSWPTRGRRAFLRLLVAAGRPVPKRWAKVYPLEAADRALARYQLRAYQGRVLLFRSTRAGGYTRDFGWSETLGERLEVIMVPGKHLELFRPPNVEVLAERLGQALRRFAGSDLSQG